MHRELGREADGVKECEPWDRVVADAAPCDHIVQLYQDQDFLNRAVCRFVGAGLANGEGIILVPTLTHWTAIRPRLEAEGVNMEAARERGQLTVVDANQCLPRFMRDVMPGFALPREGDYPAETGGDRETENACYVDFYEAAPHVKR